MRVSNIRPVKPIRATPLAPVQVIFLIILPCLFSCIGVWIGIDGSSVPSGGLNAAWRWVFFMNAASTFAGLEILNGIHNHYKSEAAAEQERVAQARAEALDEFLGKANLTMSTLEDIQAERRRTGFDS